MGDEIRRFLLEWNDIFCHKGPKWPEGALSACNPCGSREGQEVGKFAVLETTAAANLTESVQ
jgi:hypothetical protein